MHKNLFYPVFLLGLTLFACNSDVTCEINVTDFNSFLGLTNETKEIELPSILGNSNGGYYNDDETSFIYTYQKHPNIPVAVATNSKTFQVETVLLEVLSVGSEFDNDIYSIHEYYEISECQKLLLGKNIDELKEIMGTDCAETKIENQITSLVYNSSDFKTSVDFRFFPEQQFRCSAIIVNWY